MTKLFIYCNYSIIFNDVLNSIGSSCRRVAVLNRKVSSDIFHTLAYASTICNTVTGLSDY
jgi:hypothetical protein